MLPASSCKDCRDKTSAAELQCLREMLIGPRTRLNVRTRHKKERPKALRVGEFDAIGDGFPPNMANMNFRWRDLPVEQHPASIVLPVLPIPGLLIGRVDGDGMTIEALTVRPFGDMPKPAHVGRKNAEFVPMHPGAFAGMLAKISHGLAFAELGPDSFVSLLPDFILGRRRDYNTVIGSTPVEGDTGQKLVSASLYQDNGYVLAQVQLFSNYGFRPYLVVVGEAR